RHDAEQQIALPITFHRVPDRFFDQATPSCAPNTIAIEPPPELLLRNKRLQHRVPDLLGEDTREVVKFLHLVVLRFIPGQVEYRTTTHLFGHIAQEQTVV